MLKLWTLLQPFLPYIGALLAIWALWTMAVSHGKDVQRRAMQPTIDGLRADLITARGNADRLKVSLDEQSAASKRLAAIEADRIAETSRQLAAAETAARSKQQTIDKLRRSAAQASGDPCEPSDAVMEDWK